jgi:transposase
VWTREQLLPLARSNPEALVDIILALQEQVQTLSQRVEALEARLAQNSNNSSKPPSTDGYAKPAPKSLRQKTGRKSGGQAGHPGYTLKPVEHPDHFVLHRLDDCTCGCGGSLREEPAIREEKRQVFELPPQRLEVTEHRAEVKRCPRSGKVICAAWPTGVNAPVQYGPRFSSWLVYCRIQQLLPLDRISQLCADLFGHPVSEATIEAALRVTNASLANFQAEVTHQLRRAAIAHVDETGLRVAGKLHWLHVVSTAQLTWYGVHPKRGREAMDHFGILPYFTGCLIHDCWKPYFGLDCFHGLCNAHLLRELIFLHEELHQAWARRMFDLLLEIRQFVIAQKEIAPMPSIAQLEFWYQRYETILQEGRAANQRKLTQPAQPRRRGRVTQTKTQNLLDRLEQEARRVLAFLHNFHVPFSNNQAEQDLRMIRVQQKISGSFRTMQGAQTFANIRSYLSTMRKNGRDILDAIVAALSDHPVIPAAPA